MSIFGDIWGGLKGAAKWVGDKLDLTGGPQRGHGPGLPGPGLPSPGVPMPNAGLPPGAGPGTSGNPNAPVFNAPPGANPSGGGGLMPDFTKEDGSFDWGKAAEWALKAGTTAYALYEAYQAKKQSGQDSATARGLTAEGAGFARQAAQIALSDYNAGAPHRAAFMDAAMRFSDPSNPFSALHAAPPPAAPPPTPGQPLTPPPPTGGPIVPGGTGTNWWRDVATAAGPVAPEPGGFTRLLMGKGLV